MKTRQSRQRNPLKWCVVLLAVMISPAWGQDDKKQDNKHESAPAHQNSAPKHQEQRANTGHGSNSGHQDGHNRPAPTNGGKSAQGNGNRPATANGGNNAPGNSNQPATANGDNSGRGFGNRPSTASGGNNAPNNAPNNSPNNAPGRGNRPAFATGDNNASGGGNRPGNNVRRFTPPNGATAKPNSRGGTDYVGRNGTQFNTGKAGNLTGLKTKNGTVARFDSTGRVARIHSGKITINQGPRGGRTVVTRMPNGGRVVSVGRGRGYVERPYMRGGRPYLNRTYVYGGRSYVAVYRGYSWHGHLFYRYVPPFYYAPAFYGWAYRPWGAPVFWGWGWGGAPWYGYYGYYFRPYPSYVSAAFWLTDFVIAANLQAAYQAQADANAQAQAYSAPPPSDQSSDVTLTPEVKQAIADEVSAQLAAQQAAAANPTSTSSAPDASAGTQSSDQLPDALDPKSRTFVVSTALSETMADGTACSLSSGDILTRIANTPDANQNVTVMVTSSQNGDCVAGTQLAVAVQDLQDMQNDFRQNLNTGLQSLASSQGQKGMPGSPAPGQTAVPDGTAQPDADAASQIDQTDQDADKAAAEVQQSQDDGGGND